MGLFGLYTKKEVRQEIKAAVFGVNRSMQAFYQNFSLPGWESNNPKDAFTGNDQIYSVVNKIAETTALIPAYVYEVKKETKQLKAATARQFYTTKAILDIIHLQKKSLEDLPEDDWYVRLLARPNEYQNGTEFATAGYIYYLLWGEAIGYKFRLEEGVNKGKTSQIYWLPPSMVTLGLSSTFPRVIETYSFWINGIAVLKDIPATEFIHIRKANPQISNTGEEFRGLSPLQPYGLQRKIQEATDKRIGAQMENGGVPGLIYQKDLEGDEETQTQLDNKRAKYVDFTRNKDNAGMPYMTAGELGYIATGLRLVDMDALAVVKIAFKRLCNIYKISDTLFNNDTAATESNVQGMIQQMYSNACLPLAYTFRDAYNNQLLNESDDIRRFQDVDISSISELQDNMKDLANVISALPGGITMNEIRALYKWDRSEEPIADKLIVKSGYELAENLNGVGNVDPTLL